MAAEPLTHAADARHRRAVERTERALRDLDTEGAAVSFQAVARRASDSRQWLYTQPALRSEIERLRDRGPSRADGIPTRQRATEASLRQRLESLRTENEHLREEDACLKTELALAYGAQRGPQWQRARCCNLGPRVAGSRAGQAPQSRQCASATDSARPAAAWLVCSWPRRSAGSH